MGLNFSKAMQLFRYGFCSQCLLLTTNELKKKEMSLKKQTDRLLFNGIYINVVMVPLAVAALVNLVNSVFKNVHAHITGGAR